MSGFKQKETKQNQTKQNKTENSASHAVYSSTHMYSLAPSHIVRINYPPILYYNPIIFGYILFLPTHKLWHTIIRFLFSFYFACCCCCFRSCCYCYYFALGRHLLDSLDLILSTCFFFSLFTLH